MFYALDEYPCLGSKGLSPYPDEWDDQQDMSPTRVRFTPATGALSGVDTWFEYYRGLNDLISAGGRAQIGVRTAAVATFNGYNFDPQRAANPVIAYDAVASLPVLGGLYNDFRAVVYNSKIRLFIAIYGNPSGSNRCAIFESADGFTFTYVGEAQKDATYLGRTIGALANVSGTLVSLVSIADGAGGGNGRQKWISTDGGLTWLDRGLAIHVGDEGDWNGLNYVGGTMQLEGDYYVALLPGMPFIGNDGGGDPYLDWPEAVGAFRIPAASILTADVLWEANSSNPLIIAGPTHNALWHMALFEDRGTIYSTVETWGVPGFENIGTATTRALRTTPYYGTESRVSSSQLYELKMASRHWLDSWTAPVVADGSYTLRHVQSGKFVSVVDGQPVLTEAGTIAEFAIERELSFYTISNADLCLSAIDDLMQTGFEFVENPGALDNVLGQWWIMPWEDRPADQPQLVVLTNRYSRLAASLPRDTETEGAPLVQAPFLGHASMVFELAPVVRAETTTEFPDPENPLLNKDLPSGDLVGTTEPQNLANKTLALAGHTGSIAQLITAAAAGRFNDLPDGSVVWAGGCPFAKQAGAAVYSLPVGFVPADRITAAHWGITRATTADVTAKLQAMIDYAEVVAIGLRDRVPVYGTGAEMTVTAPLYNTLGSIAFMDWKLIAAAGSWGTLTYATVPILGDEHPVATAMMMIGGRYAAVPVTQNISPEFGPGFTLDGNRLAMGVLAISGVDEPVGEIHVDGGLAYQVVIGKITSSKWQQTLYISGAKVSSDENTPCFRTGRGLWDMFGDNQFGSVHVSYCRENIYSTASPFFITYGHVFGGWKGDGPDWRVWSVGTTTITVDGSGKVLTFPVTTGGAGYTVGDTLYIEKWAGDTQLDYAANRHQNPDNWPGLCCVVVTSVNGSGGITGLRVVKDRWNTEGRGLGYTAGTYNLYHVQKISPININLVENGALTVSTLYLDKAIALMDGTYKLQVQTCHFVADDELSLANMLVFKARTGKDLLTNFEMHDVHYNFTKTYGSYDPRNIIFIDETEVPFASASPVIGMALPNQASQIFNAFPTTIGRTERIFASEAFSGAAGGYYVDWDLGDAGFAGQLYRLPGTKTLRFSSVKNPSKTFAYRYLADNPLVAPAITGTNARRHTVRVYVDDATRDGGDVIRAEWSGIVRGTKVDGTATIAGPAYISLPNPDKTAIDPSALWSGANSGVLGEWWSSRSGLYTDLAATTPCTTDGDLIKAWVGKRGILTALATPGEELIYRIDANGVPYVQTDGTLRRLITPNYNMSSVGVVSIFAAAINMQDAASGTIFNNNGLLTKSWRLNVPANTSGGVSITADGGASVSVSDNSIALKPQRLAITGTTDLGAGTQTLNVNGRTQKTTSGSFGGATVWDNKPISIGARATGSAFLPTANIYEVAFFGKIYTDAELLAARKLLADAAGVVL